VDAAAGDGDGNGRRVGKGRPPGCHLAAGFGEQPAVERDDQPRLLGDPPERLWSEHASLRVGPPHRRLDGDRPPGRQLDPRLEVGQQVAPGHRAPQVRFEAEALPDHGRRPRLVDRVSVPPSLLGLVERRVGVAQQLRGLPVVWPGQDDPDARRGGGLVAAQLDGGGERRQDPLGGGHRLGPVADPVEQHRELVASDPGDGVDGPDATPEAIGDGDEEAVSRRVAEGVVDEFEPVEIEEEHGDCPPFRPEPDEGRGQPLGEELAVWQAGQRVMECSVGKLRLGLPPEAFLAGKGSLDDDDRRQQQDQHPGAGGGEAGHQDGKADLGDQRSTLFGHPTLPARHDAGRALTGSAGGDHGQGPSHQAGHRSRRDDGEERPGAVENRLRRIPTEGD
jgi:hypothetical protein